LIFQDNNAWLDIVNVMVSIEILLFSWFKLHQSILTGKVLRGQIAKKAGGMCKNYANEGEYEA